MASTNSFEGQPEVASRPPLGAGGTVPVHDPGSGSKDSGSKDAWQEKGNCIGQPEAYFFPEGEENVRIGKSICGACIVRDECLEYALDNREKYGLWGGMTEKERRRELRKRAMARQAIADI